MDKVRKECLLRDCPENSIISYNNHEYKVVSCHTMIPHCTADKNKFVIQHNHNYGTCLMHNFDHIPVILVGHMNLDGKVVYYPERIKGIARFDKGDKIRDIHSKQEYLVISLISGRNTLLNVQFSNVTTITYQEDNYFEKVN